MLNVQNVQKISAFAYFSTVGLLMDFTQDLSTSEDTSQITTANMWCGLTGSLNFCSKVNLKYNREHLSTRKKWCNTWRGLCYDRGVYEVWWNLTSFRIIYWYFYHSIENRAIRTQERSCILQDKGDCLYTNKNTSDGWNILWYTTQKRCTISTIYAPDFLEKDFVDSRGYAQTSDPDNIPLEIETFPRLVPCTRKTKWR